MGLLGLAPTTAHAATSDEITRFELSAVVDADGVFTVTQTIDVRFASSGHGPYLWFVTTQGYDETYDRRITYSQFKITSPTHAPVNQQSGSDQDSTWVRVGNPNKTVSGTQTYVISYTVSGIVNPGVAESGLDEIYWNVIGTGWTIPISNASVTIQGPADPVKTTCYMGADFTDPCTANSVTDSVATFTQKSLRPGEGLAVVAGYPAGTYPGAKPDLITHKAILEMTRLDIDATVRTDGVMSVRQTMDVSVPATHSYATFEFSTRQTGTGLIDRLISYSKFAVTRPDGTAAQVTTNSRSSTADVFRVYIPLSPTEGRNAETYVMTYEISGLVDPFTDPSREQILWYPLGQTQDMPVAKPQVTIRGPGNVLGTTCSMDNAKSCLWAADGSSATFSAARATDWAQFWVQATWPAGTFPQAKPHVASMNPFEFRYAGIVPGLAGLAALGAVGLVALIRRGGRDVMYANVTPGDTPWGPNQRMLGSDSFLERAMSRPYAPTVRKEVVTAPVRFEPPNIPPRAAGAIVREGVSDEDITATIIDMAVRGLISINCGPGGSAGTTLTGLCADPKTLEPVERRIYRALFDRGQTVSLSDMATGHYYGAYQGIQLAVRTEFEQRDWYRSSPRFVRTAFAGLGWAVCIVGFIVALLAGMVGGYLGVNGLGWFGFAALVLGVGLAVSAKRMPVRTAEGSAAAVQAIGFQTYLETAEADQIRWEEGQDIFSRYLPYAIAYGCAERWADTFATAVAQGRAVASMAPTAYSWIGQGQWNDVTWMINSMNHSYERSHYNHTEEVRAQAASSGGSDFWSGSGSSSSSSGSFFSGSSSFSSGSSGGSGFSGGGGGGGVGGGGGGTW